MNENRFIAISLTPASTLEFPVLVSKEFESETTPLTEIFVVFHHGGKKILGKLIKPTTTNPYINIESGHALFDWLKRKGQLPHLEEPDSRICTCKVIGYKGAGGRITKLQSSVTSQTLLYLATEEDLRYFFGYEVNSIHFFKIRETPFLVPIYSYSAFFHWDITAPTGWGKTFIGGEMAISLNDHGVKTWFFDVTGQIAEDDYHIFERLPEDPRKVITLNQVQIETSPELIAQLEKTYEFKRMPFSQKIRDVSYWLKLYMRRREQWNYPAFIDNLAEAIRRSYKQRALQEERVQDTQEVVELLGGEERWKKYVTPRLKAPYTINSLNTLAEQGKLIVFDLKTAERFEGPIFAEVLLNKLFRTAKAMYEDKRVEYCFNTVIFIDECQDFVPELTQQQWYNKECANQIIRIAKQGRKFGLGLVLMTQRYINVAKEALTQMNTHLVGNVLYGDRNAVKANLGITAEDLQRLREDKHEFYFTGLACPTERMVVAGVSLHDIQGILRKREAIRA